MPVYENTELSSQIQQSWAMMAAAGDSGSALKSSPLTGVSRLVSAMVTSQGHNGIFIQLGRGESVDIPVGLKPNAMGALKADIGQYTDGHGVVVNALSIWCIDSSCDGAFIAFVLDFLGRITGADLSALLNDCYKEFQRLIGSLPDEASKQLTGLLGELLVLRDLVAIDPKASRFWGGMRGERHDFRNRDIAVEVKTSLRSETKSEKVRISDWDQLEVPDDGRLYLHVIRLERVNGGAITFSGLVQEIKNRLAGPELESFENSVSASFFSQTKANQGYSIQRRETFIVVEGFPRLVKSMLAADCRAGLSAVSYELDLSQASAFLYRGDFSTALINGAVGP